MLSNYLKVAIRSFLRNKRHSFINVLGLAIGLAACLAIITYLQLEWSYDSFHDKGEQIYRVKTDYIRNGEVIFDAADNFAGVGPALKRELPEVLEYARLYNEGKKFNPVVSLVDNKGQQQSFMEEHLFFADASLLDIFDFPLVAGDQQTVLQAPNTVIISASTAQKYFAGDSPIGRTIRLNNNRQQEHLCEITGVFADIPPSSHLKFDLLFSYQTLYERQSTIESAQRRYEESWRGRDNFLTYLLLSKTADIASLEAQFPRIIDKYKPGYTEVDEQGQRMRSNNFELQPLQDIHLYSKLLNETEEGSDPETLYALLIMAIFILAIAWINYINLATARSIERAKEVGIRRIVGGSRGQLIMQFLWEAILLNILSLMIALMLLNWALPWFSELSGNPLSLSRILHTEWIIGFAVLFAIGTLLSGLYPALVLSRFLPQRILSGVFARSSQGLFLRKALVVFQFVASTSLIIGTLVIFQQIRFMQNFSLGFNPDQTLIVERPSVLDTNALNRQQQLSLFKEQLDHLAAVQSVSRSHVVPGNQDILGIAVTKEKSQRLEDTHAIHWMFVDEDFIETYQMKLLAGEYFSTDYLDTASVILTESAVHQLGFESVEKAINDYIHLNGDRRRLVKGVLQDFHQESLRSRANPTLFLVHPGANQYYSIRINAANSSRALAGIEETFRTVFPGNPFNFFFLDDYFNQQYKKEEKLGAVFGLFAGLAIFIACLGLIGLASFATIQRTKEIGVRKVLGATIVQIFTLLTKDFMKLILMAGLVAIPLSYWLLQQWLEGYAYTVPLEAWYFIFPLGTITFLALFTIGSQSLKTAMLNPVDTLRNE